MINKVILVGRITRDPEIRYSQTNMPFVGFSVACNRVYTDRTGARQENTDFVNCVVWGRVAENLARFVKKGALLGIEGRIQSRTVEQDGQNRSIMEVNCESIQFLDSRNNNQEQGQYQQPQYNQPQYQQPQYQQPQYSQPQYQQPQYNQQPQYQRQQQPQQDVFAKTNDVAIDDLPF